jgi:CBS domain containing-hemolysin-like protein
MLARIWLAFAIGFTVITFLHIVAGELAPKSLAIQKPLAISLWVAKPLQWFYRLFYRAIWILNHAAFRGAPLLRVGANQ